VQQQASLIEWGDIWGSTQPGSRTLARSPLHFFLALSILLICLGFNIYYAFFSHHPGFTYDVYWTVQNVLICSDSVLDCGSSNDSIQVGDKIVEVGSLSFSGWFVDRSVNPFAEFRVDESVPLTIDRDGQTIALNWRIPPVDPRIRNETVLFPIFVYLPFWLVGSIVFLLIRSHGTSWLLFILLNYITAMWLAMGLSPSAPPPLAVSLVHALSWVMAAVYLHFHLLVPEPVIKKVPRFIFPVFYSIMGILLVLELFKVTPVYFYIIAVFVAFVGSFFLVTYQAFRASTVPNKVVSRIMMAGVTLAFIPGLFLWIFPMLLNVDSGSLIYVVVPIISIAAFPLFYLYAIYKKILGSWEFKLNRLLYYYTLFLLTFTILSLIFLAGNRWQPKSNDISVIFIIAVAAVVILFSPLQRRFQHFLDQLAFGSGQTPEELYRKYSTRIPASVDKDDLKSLLEDEILPNLGIQESAIYLRSGKNIQPLYEFNLPDPNQRRPPNDLDALLNLSHRYIPPESNIDGLENKQNWVRLVVPIESGDGVIGVWLFGDRYPDNFYSLNDIQLMESLADQLASTIENQQLIEEVKRELEERRRAELQKQQFADRINLIHKIDQAILAAESTYEIAQAALNRIPRLIPCNQACILIFHHENQEAELLAVLNDVDKRFSTGRRFPLSTFSELLNGLDDSLHLDIKTAKTWSGIELPPILDSQEFDSSLLMPLTTSNRLIGIIYIASNASDAFSQDQLEIASEVANSLAVAIQNRRLISTVNEHRRELQKLSNKLMIAQETERTRISQELHDEIGQLITAVLFNVAAIERGLPNNASPEIQERIADTNELIEELMEHIRSMSLELRPPMLQDLGLIPTLRWYIKNSAKRLDVAIHYDFDDIEYRYSDEIETAIYRIVQEALSNAVRHGQADEVKVSLVCSDSTLELIVIDNGKGFDPEVVFSYDVDNKGAGLLGIRERVTNLGGKVIIKSEPDRGTSLNVTIPEGN
jgi:signal transduction histidine kinase